MFELEQIFEDMLDPSVIGLGGGSDGTSTIIDDHMKVEASDL